MAELSSLKKNVRANEKKLAVQLRRLTLSDKDKVRQWLSDPYIIRLTFVVPGPGCSPSMPFNSVSADQYMNVLINDDRRITFAIEVNDEHIGNIGLKEYQKESSFSECFIEIGDGKFRNKGIGTAAMFILLDYAFDVLKMDEVRLEVLEFNSPAIRVYQKLGFVRTHRSGWHYDAEGGQYWQVWSMCLTNDRWTALRKRLSLGDEIEIATLSKI